MSSLWFIISLLIVCAVLILMVSKSGAIEKLTEALIKLFGEKNVILAVGGAHS